MNHPIPTGTRPEAVYDAAIVGGGMVGMALAVALARAGLAVALVERAALPSQLDPAFDGRVSAIAFGSKTILGSIGAWEGMKVEAEPIRDIRVSDGQSPFFLHYDHHEVGETPFGYIVENRYIRHALQEAAHGCATLSLLDGASVAALERDGTGATLRLADGRALRARLLVGADGKNSAIRGMAGIEPVERTYGQTAIVCTLSHSLPHHGMAQERFLPAGPFAVLPMRGQRSSLVWVEPDDRVGLYRALPEAELLQEIRERVGDYLGELALSGPLFTYPLALMHAKSYIGHRLALIGDAAHCIHPIAGQGVNLGFRDVGVLSELVVDAFRLGMDIGAPDLLGHYQRWRRFDNVTMMVVTDGLNHLFGTQLLPVRLARQAGLWGVSKMPGLKRFFMRHAMGMVGDLPRAVRESATPAAGE